MMDKKFAEEWAEKELSKISFESDKELVRKWILGLPTFYKINEDGSIGRELTDEEVDELKIDGYETI